MELTSYFDDFTAPDWPRADEGLVRFAMVGLGWWTREHAIPATNDLDRTETRVVVSSTAEKARSVAAEHPTVERALTYEEFRNGAATDAYDAVYVGTPNALHLPYVETAAEQGKDVLCEKPVEATAERAERLVDAASDVRLAVAYRLHVQPAARMARRLVREGFVGEPAYVVSNMSQRLLEYDPDPDQWRLDTDLVGPGASVTDLGLYPINTSRFVLDADPVAVTGSTWSGSDGFESVPDERAAFTVEFPDGVSASCAVSQNARRGSSFRIVGTAGELVVEDAFIAAKPVSLTVSRGGTTATTEFDQIDETRRLVGYFADHLLTGTPVRGDGEHALVDQRTIDAVYDAADRGERVEVE
ncbi:MAG: D-xylose 1-dehydrogenase Gfo6 [Haloarculaceae archaeon]